MYKVCIFGDGGVGKTTLIGRYMTGVFKSNTEITIGVDFHIKKLDIQDKRVSLQIWDFAGEGRFRALLPSYVLGASGGIFMYDITRYSSLRNFQEWLTIFKKGDKSYLRGTADLKNGWQNVDYTTCCPKCKSDIKP